MSDSTVAAGARAGEWSVLRMPLAEPVAEVLAIVLTAPMLLAAAIWNGFPLTFYDTGAYMFEGLGGAFVVERSPVYSIFLRLGGAHVSLWWIAILQAAMVAFVMVETARALRPNMTIPRLAAIAAVLVIGTGLPWYVGQIEPDCMTAVVVLSAYLLAFHSRQLGVGRCALLIAIAGFATGAHPSHLGLAAGLALAVALFAAIAWWFDKKRAWPRVNIVLPFVSFVLGLSLVLTANFIFTREVFVSRAGPVFLFARLVQDGIAKRDLDALCPEVALKLCPYKDHLPKTADDWLWGRSPFTELKRFEGTAKESQIVVLDSLKRFPLLHIETALADTATQFVTFRTGDQIEPQEWILYPDLDHFIPRQMHAYMHARQQRDDINFKPVNFVHLPVAWLGLLGMLAALGYTLRYNQRRPAVFFAFVLVALMGNALICGVMSNPHSRYQSRLIWLPVFALGVFAPERLSQRFSLRRIRESGT